MDFPGRKPLSCRTTELRLCGIIVSVEHATALQVFAGGARHGTMAATYKFAHAAGFTSAQVAVILAGVCLAQAPSLLAHDAHSD